MKLSYEIAAKELVLCIQIGCVHSYFHNLRKNLGEKEAEDFRLQKS